MERWNVEGQDTGCGVSKNGDHSMRTAIRVYFTAADNFSAHPKSSRAHINKRTARAAGNTRYRYNKIGSLDHKMADNCVSLTRTNTISSTITKLIKTWKTSNKSYSYNLLNHINKMYTHVLFYLQQEWEAWLAPVYKQIQTTKSHNVRNINVTKTYIRIKNTLPRLKWFITITIQRSVREARQRLVLKQSVRTFARGALSWSQQLW